MKNKIINIKKKQRCCIIVFSVKRNGANTNNLFVNVTNLKGQTLIKYSSGIIQGQKKKNKKQIKSNKVAKWIIEKISYFIRNNFNCYKVVIKGHTSTRRSLSYLKQLKRHDLFNKRKVNIVDFKNKIPIVHNGCRPPKKRRI